MSSPDAMLERAREAHLRGDLEKAIKLYRSGLTQRPRLAAGWFNLALALRDSGRTTLAAESFRKALELAPTDPATCIETARIELRLGRMDASLAVWRAWSRLEPLRPEPRRFLVDELIKLHKIDDAVAEARAGVAAIPDDPSLTLALIRLRQRMEATAEARAAAERLLAANIEPSQALLELGRIDAREGHFEAAATRFEQVIAAATRDDASAMAMLELSALKDKSRDYDKAFELAAAGKARLFELLPTGSARDPGIMLAQHRRLRTATSPEAMTRWSAGWTPPKTPAAGNKTPIFVLGFPRTGTTLIEQILAAHPGLYTTDEIQLVQPARQLIDADFAPMSVYPDWLGMMSPRQIERARNAYFERARWHIGPALGDRRIVDKQPLNTAELCFIRRIFPDAPVIVVLRDPRDTCLSCFLQPLVNVPAFYNLQWTAELYASLMGLWLHYKQVLGLRSLELRYEDLVADTPAVARQMLDFIGEPWDEQVLKFFEPKHRRFVVTPSADAVNRPVYTTATARWRRYEKHLAPIDPILRPLIEAFGYA